MSEKEELIQRIIQRQQVQQALKQKENEESVAQEVEGLRYRTGDESRLSKFGHGVALSALEGGLGLKGLAKQGIGHVFDWDDYKAGLNEQDRDVLKHIRRDADQTGGWGTAGRVTGEMAQLAIPASRLSKATQLQHAGRWAQAATTLAAEAALGGAQGLIKAPEEGEERLDNALEGAAWGGLGAGAGQVLSKALRGIRQSRAAEYLGELGVRLTPGQAAEGGLARALEYTLGILPGTAKSVLRQKRVADETFSTAMLQASAPPGAVIEGGGHAGMRELRDAYNTAYYNAWDQAGTIPASTFTRMGQQFNAALQLGEEATAPLRRVGQQVRQYLGNRTTANLDALDDKLRQEIKRIDSSQYPNIDLVDALDDMRQTLRAGTSQTTQDALNAINQQYGKFKAVESAAGSRGGMFKGEDLDGGFFGGDELATSVASQRIAKGRGAYGNAPLQDEAMAASQTLSRSDPIPWTSYIRGVAKQFEIPFTGGMLDTGANLAMGRTALQQRLRQVAAFLRNQGVTAGTAGISAQNINDSE